MQVNAISAYSSNLNFEGRKAKKNKPAVTQPAEQPKHSSKLPLYTALALIPIGVGINSCKPDIYVHAHAEATATAIPVGNDTIYLPGDTIIKNDTTYLPGDTIIKNDTTYLPGDTIIKNDTIYLPGDTTYIPGDTIYIPGDTVVVKDTVYIPPEFQFPRQIEDSLNIWRGDYLDTPVEGDDGRLKDKALLYMAALRAWDYNKLETAKLNLQRSDSTEARYDHKIYDPNTGAVAAKNDIRVTLVRPGDLTVVTEDGTVTDQVSGLLFNEDGVKTFAHSNGRDKIYVYDKQMSGEYYGKYLFKGTVERGYLDEGKVGKNILLNGMISEGTEDHYIKVNGKVVDVADILAMEPGERLVLD